MGRNGWYRAIVGGTALCVVTIAVTGAAFVRRDVHAEYVKYLSGKDTITGYLAYPERKDPAPGVVVIHEIFGMSDFIRQTTEQLAKDGFVALAPDLLSRRGGTPPATDDARKLLAGLNPDTRCCPAWGGVSCGRARGRKWPIAPGGTWFAFSGRVWSGRSGKAAGRRGPLRDKHTVAPGTPTACRLTAFSRPRTVARARGRRPFRPAHRRRSQRP